MTHTPGPWIKRTSTYINQVDGGYEFGVCLQTKGRRDKLVRVGTEKTFDDAAKAEWQLRKSLEAGEANGGRK